MNSISESENKKASTYSIRAVSWSDTTTIEEESDGCGGLSLSLAEGIHQFLQGGGTLDLKEDLVVVVGDLDVEMLDGTLWLLLGTWGSVVRHVEEMVVEVAR